MLKNINVALKREGRGMMKADNQKSAKKVPYSIGTPGNSVKSFGSEPSRGAIDKGPKTRGSGAAVRGNRSSSKLG